MRIIEVRVVGRKLGRQETVKKKMAGLTVEEMRTTDDKPTLSDPGRQRGGCRGQWRRVKELRHQAPEELTHRQMGNH